MLNKVLSQVWKPLGQKEQIPTNNVWPLTAEKSM